MKKLVYLFLAGSIVLTSCSKSEDEATTNKPNPTTNNPVVSVEKKNTSLVQGHFSTKSKECGEWGWTIKDELITYGSGTSLFMSSYPAGVQNEGFMLDVANTFFDDWKNELTDFPVFSVNGQMQQSRSAGQVNTNGEKILCTRVIDDFKSAPVIANTGVKYTVADGKIKITASTKFFAAASGTYNVAFYVVEDNAMWKQTGKSETEIAHRYVLRASTNGAWGQEAFAGNITADSFKDISSEIAVNSSWNMSNVKVYAVIWKVDSGKQVFINASANQ